MRGAVPEFGVVDHLSQLQTVWRGLKCAPRLTSRRTYPPVFDNHLRNQHRTTVFLPGVSPLEMALAFWSFDGLPCDTRP